MPSILAQPTWVVVDIAPLIFGCWFVLMSAGIVFVVAWSLIRSRWRSWRAALSVAVGYFLALFLIPAISDYHWIRTVFDVRIILPTAVGCLGIACMAWGFRSMLRVYRSPRA